MSRWHSLPAEVYELVERTPATVLLEEAEPDSQNSLATETTSRVSRLFIAPLRVLIANEPAELPNLFAEIERAVALGHFCAGFFSYECAHFFEPTVQVRTNQAQAGPLAWFGVYDRCYRFDHSTGSFLDGDPSGLATPPQQIRAGTLRAGLAGSEASVKAQLETRLVVTEHEYAERIAAIQDWIRAGDVYQLNFTVPMEVHASGSTAAIYQRLRRRQPVQYGAFLHCQPDHRILSFSPELFFRVDHVGSARRITTRPMKGTAPRGRTNVEDRELAEWLANDAKNRSENVMIVDLLRNDLGRICNYGSVRAEELFAVERYPTLLQMTSAVSGELRADVSYREIFRALFPCGSITGAPKVRAMQLIAEIENRPRGVYTCAIGFFSKERTVFNVAIRTVELNGDVNSGQGTMGIGSGIVIDSDPAAEFRECLLKAEFLTRATDPSTGDFSLIETLLSNGEFPLLELHLDRLEDSARYFGFRCDRAAVKAALMAQQAAEEIHDRERQASGPKGPLDSAPLMLGLKPQPPSALSLSATFKERTPRKVRLLLDRDGGLRIESEIIGAVTMTSEEITKSGNAKLLRVRISAQCTDPDDPMYFHKTTHRPLYAEAFRAAVDEGFDDVLFINTRGELTEGAIHNVFVEKNGWLSTPPVDGGLLAGVHRRHLLEKRPFTAERVLYLEDLRNADAIFLSNAVRGLRRAIIDWEG